MNNFNNNITFLRIHFLFFRLCKHFINIFYVNSFFILYKLKYLNVISCSGDCNFAYNKNIISIKQELKNVFVSYILYPYPINNQNQLISVRKENNNNFFLG